MQNLNFPYSTIVFVSLNLTYPLLLSLLSVLTFGDSEGLNDDDPLEAGGIRSENYPRSSSTKYYSKKGYLTMKPGILWTTFKLISNSSYLQEGARVDIVSARGTGPLVKFFSGSDSPVSLEQPPDDTFKVEWYTRGESQLSIKDELPAFQLQFQG